MDLITKRIYEIADVVGGGTPSTSNEEYWGGDIPWLSPADLTGYQSVYISHGEKFITPEGVKKSSTQRLPAGSVLFSSRAPIGYIAIAQNEIYTNQGFKSLVCKSEVINNLYLYYYLKLNLNYIKNFASGATFPELSANRIKNIKITFCKSLHEQQKIASILSAYDSQIENNQKRIKLLEQMAENLYKEWFVRFRFPGYENAEFEGGVPKGWVSLVGDNKKPKGWTYGELNQLGTFIRGKNITAAEMIEGQVPVISAGLEPAGYHNQANVCGPCLTISSSGANAGYLKYNLSDIWAADCSYYNNPDNIWFVYSSLKYLQPVISNLQCGAAQPHVYPKDVNRLCVILPPKSLITEYNRQSSLFFKNIHNLKNQIFLLTHQRDLLLPRLMSGKLSI